MTMATTSTLDELTRRCSEETHKFNRRQASDTQFCFELFRRALAEEASDALTRICQIYEQQLFSWVHSHSRFAETGESADFFVRGAISAFYFAVRGPRFARFPGLPQLLAYLKLCVHTAIAQYLRDQQPAPTVALDDAAEPAYHPALEERAEASELWSYICGLFSDPDERLLIQYAFVQDLKPRQIVAANPQRWASERDVTLALYKIRRALRNDPELRRRVGEAEPQEAGEA